MGEDAWLDGYWEDRLSGVSEWDVIEDDDPFLAPWNDDLDDDA